MPFQMPFPPSSHTGRLARLAMDFLQYLEQGRSKAREEKLAELSELLAVQASQ